MISKKEIKQLRSIIGTYYAQDVLDILNKTGKCNRNGTPFKLAHIRAAFIGLRNNTDIEAAIWELADTKKAEAKELAKQKAKILNKK